MSPAFSDTVHAWQVAVRESRHMHPRSTSMHAKARDAYSHILDSAGARAFVNEYAESAASPALSNAFAERTQACPFVQLSHTLGGHTWHSWRKKNLPPLSGSMGRMPNTMSAYKPLALRGVSS